MNGPEDASDTGSSGLELDTSGGADGGADEGFDLDASMDSIAKEIAEKGAGGEPRHADVKVEATGAEVAAATEALAPPKSWAAEKHELWKTLPRNAQEYYNQREQQFLTGLEQYKGDAGFAKQIKEAVAPYRAMLQAQGVTEHQAIQYLMNANYRLTNGTEAERRAAYEQLGRDVGIVTGQQEQSVEVDPMLKQLQSQVGQIQSTLSAEAQTRQQAARKQADDDVAVFAADKTNLYFDEVSSDMVGFINQGHDLKKAYEKAVWGNPVTRAKELARIQTEAAANKGDAKQAESAKRATSVNTRGTETYRAPTETKGKFLSDDSMKEDLRAIKARH